MAITLTYPEGCALVAGGTGNVGAGVTRRLAEAGLPVTFTYYSNEDRARSLEKKLRDEGLNVFARHMDMGSADSIDAAIDFAVSKGGRLHTVACPQGAPVPFNKIADFDIAEVERFFDTDAMGYYRLFHQTVPVLRAGGGGTITCTTTVGTRRVIAWDGISPFSKGAVEALVRQLAAEEAPNNIRCNAVGIVLTVDFPFETVLAYSQHQPSPIRERNRELVEQLIHMIRFDRPNKPTEAGDLFAFFASEQAAFITGQIVPIDGGATL